MNDWLKTFLTLSAVLCLISLGALGWLAFETTDAPVQSMAKLEPLPKKKAAEAGDAKAAERMAVEAQAAALAAVGAAYDELQRKLAELNKSPSVVKNELLLRFNSPEALAAFRNRAGLSGIDIVYSDARLKSARVRYRDAAKMAQELRDHAKDYDNIAPNYLAYVPGLPQEPQTDPNNAGGSVPFQSSGLEMINAVGDRSRWGAGVKVAVLDTGVTEHASLTGVKVTHHDIVNDHQSYHGHGTAMTSLIAGRDEANGGVAPQSEILDVRVADSTGTGDTAMVAEGIMWAVDRGAVVINISLGAAGDSSMLRDAVAYAISRGVVVVAAAGNEQANALSYPASYSGVISVAAVDAQGRQAYFSNSGQGLFISAPGVGIVSAYSDGKTVIGSGTSQAAAITSGAISALLSRNYQSQQIPNVLTQNAVRTGAPSTQVGAGILRLP
ncbi:S8 family peptidase [Brevifollis gellanilyticus]|uniref:Thermitase n=1 Tax=Brevifollis gellanilyticus TaxID=748831 RepID=A0A512M5K1_9BACT|nr:S8 family serine peptidase [Brevifollis gellanilyticus]GEP42009.1 thermitase [Brevifollis gellanilyticus]